MLPRILLASVLTRCACAQTLPEDVASRYGLTASTTLPFPQATATGSSDAANFVAGNWGLSEGKINAGAQNIAFVPDPFPVNATSSNSTKSASPTAAPVLRVTYPTNGTSGTQFLALYNGTQKAEALIVSYELALDSTFDFKTGGTLPGMRGGPSTSECEGQNASTGHNCFSVRAMWRAEGAGELFAYIPQSSSLCNSGEGVSCGGGGGLDIDRGAFSLQAGRWTRVTLFTWMNSPTNNANGLFALYIDDQQVLNKTELQIRGGDGVTTDGLWFTTAFLSSTLASEQHSYFRNVQLWSGINPSNLEGAPVTGTANRQVSLSIASASLAILACVASLCV